MTYHGRDALTCGQGIIPRPALQTAYYFTDFNPEKGSLVRPRRLELPQGFPHKHLKLARLPFRHGRP